MRRVHFLLFIIFFLCSAVQVKAQYPGPIMDSLKKYQELIKNASSNEEKIRLAMKIQKFISGKMAVDTAMLNHLPKSEKDALQQRNKQVAEIKKLKQNIDTSHSRQDKYAFIQQLQNKNDSIRLANKDATKHAVLQSGLITLPNAGQFLIDPLAPVDTSFVIIRCSSQKSDHGYIESVGITSTNATMYRQNGIIKIIASNDPIPEFVMEHNLHLVKMVAHHDISGYAARSPYNGTECHTTFKQNNKFAFVFYYNSTTNQTAAGVGGVTGLQRCFHQNFPDTIAADVGFSCTNDPKNWVMAGKAGPITDKSTVGNFKKTRQALNLAI